MFKKFLAMMLVCMMVLSLAACGEDEPADKPSATPTSAPEATNSPTPAPVAGTPIDHKNDLPADAKAYLNFEDGNMNGVAIAYSNAACNLASKLEVVDWAGSKMLKATSPVSDNVFSGVNPYIAIDVVALLGDKAADVAKVQYDIGVDHGKDAFAAVSGYFITYTGADATALTETKTAWAVYEENVNPKVYTVNVPEGGFTANAGNYISIVIDVDNGTHANIYLDNVVFLDKDGNAITPDTTKEFAMTELTQSFWLNLDWSNGVKQPADEQILVGVGGDFNEENNLWWPTKKNTLTFTAAGKDSGYYQLGSEAGMVDFKEGQVITIYYECAGYAPTNDYPYFRSQSWANEETGWEGGSFDCTIDIVRDEENNILESEENQINKSLTICQYTYDDLNTILTEKYGEDWRTKCDMLGISARGFTGTIYKVTVGNVQ